MSGLFQFPVFVLVLLFLISHEAQTVDLTIDANVWEIPQPRQTIPDQEAMAGDSITFDWQGKKEEKEEDKNHKATMAKILALFNDETAQE